MISTLRISNYAIIDDAEIRFSASMNTITGETGAGKSILLGALSFVLGERADSAVLFNRQKKCVVEAIFEIGNYGLQDFFKEADIDYADETVIRRELSDSGKSRAFINDTPVNLGILQQLADQLITIHSQHETLALGNSAFQRRVVDALANQEQALDNFKKTYGDWKLCSRQLKEAEQLFARANSEKDFISFQYEELAKIEFENINQDELENELNRLNHAEEIKNNLLLSAEILETGQQTVSEYLRTVINRLRQVAGYDQSLATYIERLESSAAELKDISRDLENKSEKIQSDPKRAEEIQATLHVIYKLQKKHDCNSVEMLVQLKNELGGKLAAFENSEEEIRRLSLESNKLHVSLLQAAKKISENRMKVFPQLESSVKKLLAEVGMAHAQLKVQNDFNPEKHLNENGADAIQFLFSANKGAALREIQKVASGGELSRLMLCIKSLLAKSVALPTLIFDEIDAGISGETAAQVGRILHGLSENHQLIAITHLPQIASKGDHHLFVYKETGQKTTHTKFRVLGKQERIQEIAKMLSGEKPTKAALETAKELLK
jgi:DNA repair protein RecN (Recombination protein N)